MPLARLFSSSIPPCLRPPLPGAVLPSFLSFLLSFFSLFLPSIVSSCVLPLYLFFTHPSLPPFFFLGFQSLFLYYCIISMLRSRKILSWATRPVSPYNILWSC